MLAPGGGGPRCRLRVTHPHPSPRFAQLGVSATPPVRRTASTPCRRSKGMKLAHPQIRPGIYGRVSSDQQAEAGTIASQVEALKERIHADGLILEPELCFLDEGYS